MQTPPIENWTGNPTEIGPMYPFVGLEIFLFIACAVGTILYIVWQARFEKRAYDREAAALADQAVLRASISAGAPDCYQTARSTSSVGENSTPAG